MTVADDLAQLYAHADEAEAFEHAAADALTVPLRDQLQGIARWLAQRWVRDFGSLDAPANPAGLPEILAELRQRLAALPTDHTSALLRVAQRALTLGVEQATREIDRSVPLAATLGLDSVAAAAKASASVADRLQRAQRLLTTPVRTHSDVMPAVAAAHGALGDLERASRWISNREVNNGSAQVADALSAGALWIAERDGCVHCLAYSGVVAPHGQHFPPDLTFGARPLKPWPDGVLDRPPLHPHCRCRITPWLDHDESRGGPTALPDALKREARRSILKGWSLESESESVRLAAADRLLARGANLPKTVEEQAQRAVRRGKFPSRTVPSGS